MDISFTVSIPDNINSYGHFLKSEELTLISPSAIARTSFIQTRLVLHPKVVRENVTVLMLSMFGMKKNSVQLPIKYNCKCPYVICIPEEIDLACCFLRKEYSFQLILKNEENIEGSFKYEVFFVKFYSIRVFNHF